MWKNLYASSISLWIRENRRHGTQLPGVWRRIDAPIREEKIGDIQIGPLDLKNAVVPTENRGADRYFCTHTPPCKRAATQTITINLPRPRCLANQYNIRRLKRSPLMSGNDDVEKDLYLGWFCTLPISSPPDLTRWSCRSSANETVVAASWAGIVVRRTASLRSPCPDHPGSGPRSSIAKTDQDAHARVSGYPSRASSTACVEMRDHAETLSRKPV